ncbi:MAG TPA: hypothetical protein VN240_12990, partial [Propylenella sp.]|nr:hypothetical protein [Propylenella sp.]
MNTRAKPNDTASAGATTKASTQEAFTAASGSWTDLLAWHLPALSMVVFVHEEQQHGQPHH